ncbi:MAG: Obg family GTPase CgtA, partial [Selenomonadales bacterium]|nr:Obg family GTPase CgtA [Selenomonadales bacterium]
MALREKLKDTGIRIFPVSAATRKGFTELMRAAAAILRELPPAQPFLEETPLEELAGDSFTITKENGVYVLSGPSMQHLVDSVNFGDEESLNWFHRTLRRWGVIDQLRAEGISLPVWKNELQHHA